MSDLFRSVMGGCNDGLVGSVVEAGSHRLNIVKKVAEGGFAVVYRATSEHTGETVAVKRLLSNDSERKKDAIREAALLRKLNHKHIVKFITGKNASGIFFKLILKKKSIFARNTFKNHKWAFNDFFSCTNG